MSVVNRPRAPLAVIGMACRLPGADNLDAFWNQVVEGRHSIAELPAERLDRALYYDEKKGLLGNTYCRYAGVVEHRAVDRNVCPINDDVAARYDISHLTLCEVVAAAYQHAGFDPRNPPSPHTGVFIGNSSGGSDLEYRLAYHTYARQLAEPLRNMVHTQHMTPQEKTALIDEIVHSIRRDHPSRRDCRVQNFAPNAAAAVVTEAFHLTGPSLVTDAACASSLMALDLAAGALDRGDIDMAVVGGAAYRKLYEWVAIAQAQSMSARGYCCPFDADADGIITSDGYGVVLVKPLDRALADGNRIYGVVRGMGISSDGKGKGFWAPRQEGQVAAIRRAYDHGLDASRLQYIEAHATSTPLGDATELASLCEALGGALRNPIPITSVKANIGHTLETAGIAGLIKTLLAMHHQIIPPAANFQTPSPAVDWDRMPFFVPTKAVSWSAPDDGAPRRAGIDAFGIGGLNVHVVVDDAPEQTELSQFAPAPAVLRTADTQARQEPIAQSKREPIAQSKREPIAQSKREPIAVIGMSGILPGANSLDAFKDLLHSGRDPKRPIPADRWNSVLAADTETADEHNGQVPIGGFISDYEFDWRKFRIPPKQLEAANPLQFLLLDAVAAALVDAGYAEKEFDKSRCGTVVGTVFQSDFIVDTWHGLWMVDFRQRLAESLRKRGAAEAAIAEIGAGLTDEWITRKPALRDDTASISSSTLASRISKFFDLMGGATSIDAGGTSSPAALSSAMNLLQSGRCDIVLCAAGQQAMNLTQYEQNGVREDSQNVLSQGTVPGEGVAAIVLKRLCDARRDGDSIRAVIHSVGVAADVQSTDRAVEAAMKSAVDQAHIAPARIGIIETSSVDARFNKSVLRTMATIRGEAGSDSGAPILVGSTPALIGDTKGAAGLVSLLKTIIALECGRMPATFGLTSPSVSIDENRVSFDPLVSPAPIYATSETGACMAAICSFAPLGPASAGGQGPAPAGGQVSVVLLEGGIRLPQYATPDKQPNTEAADTVIEFDATRSRKDRMRQQALSRPKQASTPAAPLQSAAMSASNSESHSPPNLAETQTSRDSLVATQYENVMLSRFVFRMVPSPLPDQTPKQPAFHGASLVMGDNPAADALRDRLKQLGVPVFDLPVHKDLSATLEELERIWQQQPVPHLFIMTGRNEDETGLSSDETNCAQRLRVAVTLPTAVCSKWLELVRKHPLPNRSSLVAATALGGDFGQAGHFDNVEGGGLVGLLKALDAKNNQNLIVKVVDSPVREPAKMVATEILNELAADDGEIEVGYVRGSRQLVRSIVRPPAAKPGRAIQPGGVWVMVGRPDDWNTELVRALKHKFELHIHSINAPSSTMHVPSEKTDVFATRHICETADLKKLAEVLEDIRRKNGPIDGILVSLDDVFAGDVSLSTPEQTVSHLEQTTALMQRTLPDTPRFFVALESTAGRFGLSENVEQSVAWGVLGSMLARYRNRHRDRTTLRVTIPKSEFDAAHREAACSEWVTMVIEELQAGRCESEVIMTTHPGGPFSSSRNMPTAEQLKIEQTRREMIARAPIVNDMYFVSENNGLATAVFDPTSDPFLLSHLDESVPLFPAVMGIEMFVEAASILTGGRRMVELRDFNLVNGLRMAVPRNHRAMVHIHLDGDLATCSLHGDYYDKDDRLADPNRKFQTGTLKLADAPLSLPDSNLDKPDTGWREIVYPDNWQSRSGNQCGTVFYGPALRTLKAVNYQPADQPSNAWGRLVAPCLSELNGWRLGDEWRTAPALLDAVLLSCDLFAAHNLGTRQFPHAIELLRFGRMPRDGEVCLSRLFYRGRQSRHFVFDFQVTGDDGSVLFDCQGCRFIDIDSAVKQSAAKQRTV